MNLIIKRDREMKLTSPRSDLYTIRGLPQAVLRASSSVITDTDTVQMDCMNRENQKMDTCFFTVDGMESNMKESRSCQLSLTGSDIIHWSGGQRSSVIITCFYSVYKSQVLISSPYSEPVTVAVWKFFQAVLRASSSVITDTDTVQMDCKNRENLKMDTCFFIIDRSRMKESRSCHLSLTGYDIIHWSGGQRSSVTITCSYSAQSHGFVSSPHSDPVTVTVQITTSTTTAQTTTTTTTSESPMSYSFIVKVFVGSSAVIIPHHAMGTTTYHTAGELQLHQKGPGPRTTRDSTAVSQEMWIKILPGAVCSVFVLTGLICLCRCVCKKRTKRQGTAGETCASGPAEAYSMITSVPDTSQHTGLKHPQSHQDSQSDALDNAQHKKGCTEDNENVYHVYCTIPDKPVNVAAGGQNYSLAY
ncbi:hypothetical protein IRJ41_008437 [Triplophysa rosa]|uniref:Uncharacterized protein n=1 Tax=Triplophysa rosa TaxID=992332 RepID=A0A9W7TFG4_TRIRA|nr:hypothetical protein IRJ41_008437 [Triplophysa rosa]